MSRRSSALLLALLVLPCLRAAAEEERDFLPALRLLFYRATTQESAVQEAVSFLKERLPPRFDLWPPVAQAYFGALEGLQGKYSRGLVDKLLHVQRAISVLRELPEKDPRNPEILFLRFSLFHQLPGFFGVRGTTSPDLERLISMLEERRYEQVPADIQRSMAVYLARSGEADQAQAARLQVLLPADAPPP